MKENTNIIYTCDLSYDNKYGKMFKEDNRAVIAKLSENDFIVITKYSHKLSRIFKN